jgi:hypothetical protein
MSFTQIDRLKEVPLAFDGLARDEAVLGERVCSLAGAGSFCRFIEWHNASVWKL